MPSPISSMSLGVIQVRPARANAFGAGPDDGVAAGRLDQQSRLGRAAIAADREVGDVSRDRRCADCSMETPGALEPEREPALEQFHARAAPGTATRSPADARPNAWIEYTHAEFSPGIHAAGVGHDRLAHCVE